MAGNHSGRQGGEEQRMAEGRVYINPTGERALDDICFSRYLSFSERPRPSLHLRLSSPRVAVLMTFMIRAVIYFPT